MTRWFPPTFTQTLPPPPPPLVLTAGVLLSWQKGATAAVRGASEGGEGGTRRCGFPQLGAFRRGGLHRLDLRSAQGAPDRRTHVSALVGLRVRIRSMNKTKPYCCRP